MWSPQSWSLTEISNPCGSIIWSKMIKYITKSIMLKKDWSLFSNKIRDKLIVSKLMNLVMLRFEFIIRFSTIREKVGSNSSIFAHCVYQVIFEQKNNYLKNDLIQYGCFSKTNTLKRTCLWLNYSFLYIHE